MNVLTTILTWIVTVGCVFVAYVAVREVEQAIVRRSFSLLLTIVLVIITTGLLLAGLSPVTSNLLDQYFYSDLGDRWPGLIGAILAIGAVVLVWREVSLRVRRGACTQCGAQLHGHVVCPQCGWGGLSLPGGITVLTRQAGGAVHSAAHHRPAPWDNAPTMVSPMPAPGASQAATGQPVTGQPVTGQPITGQPITGQPVTGQLAADRPAGGQGATQQARFCASCGTLIVAGHAFCAHCGASTTATG